MTQATLQSVSMAHIQKPALLIDQFGPAIHQTRFVATLFHEGNLLLKLLWKPKAIGIQGSNVFAARLPYRSIPRGAHSRITLPDELKSGIPCYEFFNDGSRGIRGTIINHNHLDLLIGLSKDRIQRRLNVCRGIKCWNNYRYQCVVQVPLTSAHDFPIPYCPASDEGVLKFVQVIASAGMDDSPKLYQKCRGTRPTREGYQEALRAGIVDRAFLLFRGSVFSNRPAFNNDYNDYDNYNFTKSCQAASDRISDAKRCAASPQKSRKRRSDALIAGCS